MNNNKTLSLLFNFGVSILVIFTPIKPILLTILFLIFIDLITGLIAAVKQNVPITSAGLRRTISKVIIYQLVVIVGFLCETYLTGPLMPVCRLLTTLIGLVEMRSILENCDKINGSSIFDAIIKRIGSQNDTK